MLAIRPAVLDVRTIGGGFFVDGRELVLLPLLAMAPLTKIQVIPAEGAHPVLYRSRPTLNIQPNHLQPSFFPQRWQKEWLGATLRLQSGQCHTPSFKKGLPATSCLLWRALYCLA